MTLIPWIVFFSTIEVTLYKRLHTRVSNLFDCFILKQSKSYFTRVRFSPNLLYCFILKQSKYYKRLDTSDNLSQELFLSNNQSHTSQFWQGLDTNDSNSSDGFLFQTIQVTLFTLKQIKVVLFTIEII